jgi:hypothetical protein
MQPTDRASTIRYACGHTQTIPNGKGYRSQSAMRCSTCMGFSKTIGHELVCAAARQAQEPSAEDYPPEEPHMCQCGHDSDYHRGGVGSCEQVVEQFGPLGLFCECMAFVDVVSPTSTS